MLKSYFQLYWLLTLIQIFLQADSPFWTKKLLDKPVKKTRTKSKAVKKPAKKKTNPAKLFDLDDNDDDESEVTLDSLGSFFIHLIDAENS